MQPIRVDEDDGMRIRLLVPILVAVAALPIALLIPAPMAGAHPAGALHDLVDAAALRLQVAEPVAAVKWLDGGSITDPARAAQVLDAVGADAVGHHVDPGYVRDIFTDQINVTEAIEYTRFAQWKFDPAGAPSAAPDLASSRTQIDGYNRTVVEQIALHWDSLHSPQCVTDLEAARDSVVAARGLDPLYQQALTAATRSYCRIT